MRPVWSILICTTINRRAMFDLLCVELKRQVEGKPVEILYEEDNKQMSVGKKRQKLLDRSIGHYISYFDSDDYPAPNYIDLVLEALESRPDCVGFLIRMTTNGEKEQVCCHSLRYPKWKEKVDGYDYVRNVSHFNMVRRDLAIRVGFKDQRYGEDVIYANAVTRLCKTEVFIPQFLFHYRYSTTEPFKKKYGIIK